MTRRVSSMNVFVRQIELRHRQEAAANVLGRAAGHIAERVTLNHWRIEDAQAVDLLDDLRAGIVIGGCK